MNVVKLTNKIAIGSIILLIYWVFIFICTTVFGFKVFRENMTEMFSLSILGIFSVLCAAVILNIMFNLTTIAEKHKEENPEIKDHKVFTKLIGMGVSFILIFIILYAGDISTSKKKENYFVNSAKALVEEQAEAVETLSEYNFSKDYINNATFNIKLLSKIDEKFPQVTVIQQDSINNKKVLLGFHIHSYLNEKNQPQKVDYILSTSKEERAYLYSVFSGNTSDYNFSSNDGRYEIYYPVETDKGLIILHLSQYSRYGKYGS